MTSVKQSKPDSINFKYLFSVVIVLLVICNGLFFWLSKSQLINSEIIAEKSRISPSIVETMSIEEKQEWLDDYKSYFYYLPYSDNTAYNNTFERLVNQHQSSLKLAKDVFLLLSVALLIGGLTKANDNKSPLQNIIAGIGKHKQLIGLLCALFTIGIYLSLTKFTSPIVTIVGIRSFGFIAIALLILWLNKKQQAFLQQLMGFGFIVICLVQLPFVLSELMLSTNYFGGSALFSRFMDRTAGTFNQPSSLAIFSVMSAFFWWESHARTLSWSFIAVYSVAFFYCLSSSSVMGILLFLLLSIAIIMDFTIAKYKICMGKKIIFIGSTIALIGVGLLIHNTVDYFRVDYLDSLWLRFDKLYSYVHAVSPKTLILGQGLGAGSNAGYQYMSQVTDQVNNLAHIYNNFDYQSGLFIADSLLLTLIAQMGLLTTSLIYLLLIYGAFFHSSYRWTYFAIIVGSLSSNLNEAFPLYYLLALLIAMAYQEMMKKSH